jgi:hypothetical protein
MIHSLREKLAYSALGKCIAAVVRNSFYPTARIHWVQQAFADFSFKLLK